MARQPSQEGKIPFNVPSTDTTPCHTYYKVFGDLSSDAPPVILLHGGPGGGHEYLLPFADLWTRYGVPVVLYDQLGCGQSTRLRETAGDKSFWTMELFIAELDNLIDYLHLRGGFHLLGQSWGGMLAADFAGRRPRGLRRLILASALASFDLNARGVRLLRQQLPADAQEVLNKAERSDNWDEPATKEVAAQMGSRYILRASPPPPPELVAAFKNLAEDATVYQTMYGLSWLDPKGSLTGWTSIPNLHQIEAPTLVYNGEFDSSHDVATAPFFELIPQVRWITFAGSGHFCHLEAGELPEKVFRTVGDFLVQKAG